MRGPDRKEKEPLLYYPTQPSLLLHKRYTWLMKATSADNWKIGSEIRRLEARWIITFVKEHGGHLTHFNPLHNVKVVHVASRPLCNDTSTVKSERENRSTDASSGKQPKLNVIKYGILRRAPWTKLKHAGADYRESFFSSLNTYV